MSGERARLAALRDLQILDTPAEQVYDDIVTLAAAICATPIAIVNFIDADRQWGKALLGMSSSEAPREVSFCARTIQQDDGMLVVPDTLNDPEWASNAQVVGDPGLRFYAGAAIVTDDGHALGSVCVADTTGPRELGDAQIDALRALARQTASHLTLRRQSRDLAAANAQLRHLAVHDPLTGLPNRAFFEEALAIALRQRREGRPGLLFGDLDGFKQINDTLGHGAGDTLLRHVAKRLKASAREGDLVMRLAGDEFVVLCPGIEDPADLAEIADRLQRAVSQPVRLAEQVTRPEMSLGAVVAERGELAEGLVRRADEAMYANKRLRKSALATAQEEPSAW